MEITRERIEQILGAELPSESVSTATAVTSEPATEGQIKYYIDLCEQRRLTPSASSFTKKEMNVEIQRLLATPKFIPIKDGQAARITDLCNQMSMPLPDFNTLSGAYDGSASKMIQSLIELSKKVKLPITEKQMILIQNMQLCPDVYETLTDEEIANLSKNDAHEYISKFNAKYLEWKKTRLSPAQFQLIETLTERTGHKLEYSAIMTLDTSAATKFIEQIQRELKDEALTAPTLEPEVNDGYEKVLDSSDELRNIVAKLYASIGQELEEEFYETLTWDALKDLVDFVKLFKVNVENFFDNDELFSVEQKAYLLS